MGTSTSLSTTRRGRGSLRILSVFLTMLNLYSRYFFIFQLVYVQEVLCIPLDNNSRIIYDQRQTGKYNIQISIKDVAIIEVDENKFIDDTINDADEYYYDEDDLTIKPIPTWIVPSTTTLKAPALLSTLIKEPIDLKIVTNKTEVIAPNLPHTSIAEPLALNSSIKLRMDTPLPPSSAEIPTPPVHLVMKPVIHGQEAIQEIPQHTAKKSRHDINSLSNVVPHNFPKVKEIDSELIRVITAQPLSIRKLAICKSTYFLDNNGICRKKKHLSFMKSFFDILKLMRIKEI